MLVLHFWEGLFMNDQNKDSEIWEIPVAQLIPMLKILREEIIEHFKKGGRIKVTNPYDFPPQELMPNFTFDNWKD